LLCWLWWWFDCPHLLPYTINDTLFAKDCTQLLCSWSVSDRKLFIFFAINHSTIVLHLKHYISAFWFIWDDHRVNFLFSFSFNHFGYSQRNNARVKSIFKSKYTSKIGKVSKVSTLFVQKLDYTTQQIMNKFLSFEKNPWSLLNFDALNLFSDFSQHIRFLR
jgi:hypothetical protein